MSRLYAIADSKILIGGPTNPKATVGASDFTGEPWLEMGGWATSGSLGDTIEVISQKLISGGRVRKLKGTKDGGTMENTFAPDAADLGQIRFKQAIKDCRPYKFKIEWGAGCLPMGTIAASGATITSAAHGLVAGQIVSFQNIDGALPVGLTSGTTYYVIPTSLTANTFQVSLTAGGTAVATTGAGTGVNTFVAQPIGQTDMFFGYALPGAKQGGDADTTQLISWGIAVDSNIFEV